MSNRIIKVSILVIFMMFVTGLFNFCFAWETNSDVQNIDVNLYGGSVTLSFGSLVGGLPEVTETNIIGSETPSTYFDMYKNNGYIMYISSSGQLRLIISDGPSVCFSPNKLFNKAMSFNNSVNVDGYCYSFSLFLYDSDSGSWVFNTSAASANAPGMFILDSNRPIYGYESSTSQNFKLVYEYTGVPPSTEELINNCDFNVRIEFGDSEELSSNYPINNHIGMQKVTILHSLTDWKYYNVKLNVTLEDYGFWINQRFHYSHYSTDMTNDEIKDVKTICIKEPTSININKNDYLGIYSAQAGKYVRLQYKLYNKNNDELILTRTIRFRFDGDGFFILQDSSDVSGTILEDSLKDNNGNDIDKNSNNVVSNGKDLTDINTDFDFSSGFKLDVDTLKGTLENSIESSKSFFNLFSTFLGLLPIWISTLLYFFLFGVIIITLYRFLRGA